MAHAHSHAPTGRYLGVSIAITCAFVVAEVVAGVFANSLALFSDAGHNFADALALVFSWYAIRLAQRPASPERTYGYHRASILAALANAVALVVIALVIFWEAAQRLFVPQYPQSGLMIGVASAAVVVNALIAFWLHAEAHHDLNMRSAYLHMLGDALSAVGVVGAGIAVALTGTTLADPAASFLIGLLILRSSWGILTEALSVLLEGAPKGLDMGAVEGAILGVPGVLNVHDLHVWTLTSGIVACSCHIVVAEQSIRSGQQVLRAVVEELERHFHISHTTVQVEVEGCEPNDLYCTLRRTDPHGPHDHHH